MMQHDIQRHNISCMKKLDILKNFVEKNRKHKKKIKICNFI